MLIELDLKEVKSLKISSTQFIFIKLLLDEVDIKSLLDVIPVSEKDINDLIEKGIIDKDSITIESDIKSIKFENIVIDESFKTKLNKKEFFDDFFAIYPTSVVRSDGIKDYLKGAPTNCRKYYKKLVGSSQSKHDHIMTCLRFEISNRVSTGKMSYMKRMYKWLTSEEWTLYDQIVEDKKVKAVIDNKYGTSVE